MYDICAIPIPKLDVLMEDFSNIHELVNSFTSDYDRLIESRNTWEVFFEGYDDDPREIPDIPEVVNWIEKSVEEGIPWFYFMRAEQSSLGLLTFMTCCGAEHAPDYPQRYIFDRDIIMPFIKKNLDNLADFADEHDIPFEVGRAATDDIMEFVQNVLRGSMDQEEPSKNMDSEKQKKEAIERLSMLEELFELNPKVKKYFTEGKLYYSYLTGGGYIGSIDTINYDKRYAAIVKAFEKQTSYLVYHVVERDNTISLLFVSDDYSQWIDERPTAAGVMAQIVNVDTYDNEFGYIKLDHFQGALYRCNDTVYSTMPGRADRLSELSEVDNEVVERLEILKNGGIISDLDITKVYKDQGEICCSVLLSVLGTSVGVINRISAKEEYKELSEIISEQFSSKIYFLIDSANNKLAFLFLSDDPADWEAEKLALEQGHPDALVVDILKKTVAIQPIKYEFVNGGPVLVCD